jgi:hypothetical protein
VSKVLPRCETLWLLVLLEALQRPLYSKETALCGVCVCVLCQDKLLMLVMEYMPGGDLWRCIPAHLDHRIVGAGTMLVLFNMQNTTRGSYFTATHRMVTAWAPAPHPCCRGGSAPSISFGPVRLRGLLVPRLPFP